MPDPQVLIHRRATPSGRTTYWKDDAQLGLVRVTSTTAKRLVDIGAARWFDASPRRRTRV